MNRRSEAVLFGVTLPVITVIAAIGPHSATITPALHGSPQPLRTSDVSGGGGVDDMVEVPDMNGRVIERVRADAGAIDLLGAHREARHRFRLTNESGVPVKVQTITRTCKCVTMDLQEGIILPAGHSHEFDVSFEVRNGGRSAQSVFVVLDSGRIIQYELHAFGINGAMAKILMLEAPQQARPKNIRARLWVVDPTCTIGREVPILISPPGAVARWSTWTELDQGDRGLRRARRQLMDLVVDLEQFEGDYPSLLSIEVAGVGVVDKQIIPPPRDFMSTLDCDSALLRK